MKHYMDTDFVRLIEGVEEQGGRYLAETCMAREIDELISKADRRPPLSTGCEEDALFIVAYDAHATVEVNEPILVPDDSPDAPKGRKKTKENARGQKEWVTVTHKSDRASATPDRSEVRVCANDDLMRAWPRFQKLMVHDDPVKGRG